MGSRMVVHTGYLDLYVNLPCRFVLRSNMFFFSVNRLPGCQLRWGCSLYDRPWINAWTLGFCTRTSPAEGLER